jgi:hypothetical protein
MATAVVAESRYDPRCDDGRGARRAPRRARARRGAAAAGAGAGRGCVRYAQGAWEPLGFVRAGDYVRERPGLSARELYDLAHVDAALAKLPAIDAALRSGQLGWTKARLLCRVATPEDEASWLEAAPVGSQPAALAREVRAIDVGSLEAGADASDEEPGEREVLRVRVPPRVKTKWGDVKRTLRRVTGEWLPTETCVELVAAEVLSAIRLEVDPAEPPLARAGPLGRGRLRSRPRAGAAAAAGRSRLALRRDARRGPRRADARELDAPLCRAAALERGLLARIGPLLLAFADLARPVPARLPQPRRLCPRAPRDLAAQGAGAASARARLRARAGARASLARWEDHGLPGAALVPLFLAPGSELFHAAWVERAAEVTVRRLEDDVEHALVTGALDPARCPSCPTVRGMPRPSTMRSTSPRVCRPVRDPWPAGDRRLGRERARRRRAPLSRLPLHGRAPPVFARDGWRCTVPGCTSQRNLHAHHVLFRSAGRPRRPREPHHALRRPSPARRARGVIRIAGRAPGALVFEMPLGASARGIAPCAPALRPRPEVR